MKRYFFLVFVLFMTLFSSAEPLKERRIYYLDCSYSMITNNLWQPVCNDLINAINSVQDQSTELFVIPFAVDSQWHSILSVETANADSAGKANLNNFIRQLKPSPKCRTYHSETLNDLYINNRVDTSRVTYVFIMTDGKDEEQPTRFPGLLKQWNSLYGDQFVYGFYVMLHSSAKNDSVSGIIASTKHLWEVQTAKVNINLIRPDVSAVFLARGKEHYVDVPISGDLSKVNLTAAGNSKNYNVLKMDLKNGFLRVYLNVLSDLSVAPEDETVVVKLNMTGGSFDFLVDDEIKISCVNKKVKKVSPTFL